MHHQQSSKHLGLTNVENQKTHGVPPRIVFMTRARQQRQKMGPRGDACDDDVADPKRSPSELCPACLALKDGASSALRCDCSRPVTSPVQYLSARVCVLCFVGKLQRVIVVTPGHAQPARSRLSLEKKFRVIHAAVLHCDPFLQIERSPPYRFLLPSPHLYRFQQPTYLLAHGTEWRPQQAQAAADSE